MCPSYDIDIWYISVHLQTLSCTEALVKMHKTTDTLERVQQVRQEYVGLTNMLVRRLDDIHLEQKAAEGDSDKAAETL